MIALDRRVKGVTSNLTYQIFLSLRRFRGSTYVRRIPRTPVLELARRDDVQLWFLRVAYSGRSAGSAWQLPPRPKRSWSMGLSQPPAPPRESPPELEAISISGPVRSIDR